MPVERIVGIGTAMAEALTAAHDKGIVHRDLKPANVMVTVDGRVKVLDFGLAKIAGTLAGEPLNSEMATDLYTRDGVVMGTMPYMSPEQVAGLTVDQRTDIFSLGALLYEMASGRRPFAGASQAALVSSILRDAPAGERASRRPVRRPRPGRQTLPGEGTRPTDTDRARSRRRTAPRAPGGRRATSPGSSARRPLRPPRSSVAKRRSRLPRRNSVVARGCLPSPATAAPARRASPSNYLSATRASTQAAPPLSRSPRRQMRQR